MEAINASDEMSDGRVDNTPPAKGKVAPDFASVDAIDE